MRSLSVSQHTAVSCGQSLPLSFRPRACRLQHRSTHCQAQGFGSSQPTPAQGKAGKQKSAETKRGKPKAPKQKPAARPAPAGASEADFIDVEGSVADMKIPKIPVTVSGHTVHRSWLDQCVQQEIPQH